MLLSIKHVWFKCNVWTFFTCCLIHHFSYFQFTKFAFMHLADTLESHLRCIQCIHFISTCVPCDQTHENCAAITQCSTTQAAQIPNYNADKCAQCSNTKYSAVGRGANLINALIGCISGKWQTTYKVVWVGGHVGRSILSFCGGSLLNKFTGKQQTTVTLQLIVTQAFQGKHTALTSIKIQLLTEINYIWSASLWRRDPINLVSLTAFARTKKKKKKT